MAKKLRVLVVDDSAYNRQTISEILNSHPDMEVVGKAYDGEEGLKLVAQLKPDLVTLDIEMPRMDGFTFLRIVMSKMPTPVIVISSHSRKQEVFQALELGALDFVAKPSHHIAPDIASLREEIISKALAVHLLEPVPFAQRAQQKPEGRRTSEFASNTAVDWQPPAAVRTPLEAKRLVCIGASTGGPPALESLFKAMGTSPQCAFLVAQHMPSKFTRAFAERLNRMTSLDICEGEEGAEVWGGCVYIAPGGRHMELQRAGNSYFIHLLDAREGDRYAPSIDRLFESAARAFELSMLTVILTGMGADGSQGVRMVRAAGGRTIAESQESSIVFGMPKEAIRTGCIDEILPLGQIIERVAKFASSST
jgi:two-component system, chemotaxis family, protein-glutamate methylesterase/glutaminase